MEQPAIGSDVI